jgi:hypothetical protein
MDRSVLNGTGSHRTVSFLDFMSQAASENGNRRHTSMERVFAESETTQYETSYEERRQAIVKEPSWVADIGARVRFLATIWQIKEDAPAGPRAPRCGQVPRLLQSGRS